MTSPTHATPVTCTFKINTTQWGWATHSSRAFARLGIHRVAYKACRAGVAGVHVDPAYTSRACAECGHVDRANRVSQVWFACRNCGFVDRADRNNSRNIRARARELWRRGAPSTAPAPPRNTRMGLDADAASHPVMPVVQARRFSDG
ncbi:zinc ribbon domain-containing protein [Streptomyces mirabilis]|uniref:zinc ribbon domain-containing protein n=1 Tax=Streptomyces mirabilis TaxID=68239 RepID=UPI00352FBABF